MRHRRAGEILAQLGVNIPTHARVDELPLADQQMVEIAKALVGKARLLILDEPTAVISGHEVDLLFQNMRRLRAEGLGIVYISHRLEEIFEIADRVTVLKDGQVVGTSPVSLLTREDMITMMVGRRLEQIFPPRPAKPASGPDILNVRRLQAGPRVRDVSLNVKAGEIVGVAGMVGAGRTEMAEAIFGTRAVESGVIEFDGEGLQSHDARQAIGLGLGFLTENRKDEGLFLGLSIAANIVAPALGGVTKRGLIDGIAEREIALHQIREFSVAPPSPEGYVVGEVAGNDLTEESIMELAVRSVERRGMADGKSVEASGRNRLYLSYLIVTALLLVLIIAGGVLSDRFLTWRNAGNLFQQLMVLGMVSLGQTFVVLIGGIDLAIGSLVSVITVFLANFLHWQPDMMVLAVLIALVAAAAIGALNGVLTVVLRIHPLIVTLGMSSIIFGATLMYRKEPGGSVPPIFEEISYGSLYGVPFSAVALVFVFALAGLWLQRTRSGRALYFVGGDREAARLNGLPVDRITVLVYALSGLCAGCAAIFLTARTGVGDPRIGAALTLQSITPVVVGGTILAGGRGGVLGTFLGVLLVTMLNNLLNFVNVSSYYQWVIQGLIIIVAKEVKMAPLDIRSARPKTFSASAFFERYGLMIFLALMLIVAAWQSPVFLRPANLVNVMTLAAPLGMVVIGQTFVIIVRGLDLSVASLMATIAVLATAFRATGNEAIPAIFAVAIVFSALVGFINGWLVAKRNVSPFLATLAMMIILQGVRFAYTGGAPISTLPPGMAYLATGRLFGIPVNLITLGLMAVAFGIVLHRSRLGREIFMVGSNPKAARLNGVASDPVVILCYVICAICAGIGGLFLLGYVGTVSNWVGQGYELDSIVAAVMGGVALSGGRGNIFSALLGMVVLVVINNVVILLGFPIEIQQIIKGVIIIGAAAFYRTALI
eukprot:gene10646-10717_t